MAYYMIKSKLSGFFLDVQGGTKSGHKVIPYDRNNKDNQIWFDDELTGTIRSKDENGQFCLDIEGDQLVVRPYQAGDGNQQWVRQANFIRNRRDNNKALDIYGKKKDKGVKIGPYNYNGQENQQWEFEFVGGLPAPPANMQAGKREFFIVSDLAGKVLDVSGEKKEPGAKLCIWDKHPEKKKNQLWYQDNNGYIRSALNDCMFINEEKAKTLITCQPSGNPRAQWFFSGNKMMSRAGECADVYKAKEDKGTDVISYDYKSQNNQHWRQEFV